MNKNKEKKIANERIRILFDEATKVSQKLANRYIELARKIAMKYRIKLSRDLKRKYCKYCYSYLKNPRVRTRNKAVEIYCKNCKKTTRIPFVKERKLIKEQKKKKNMKRGQLLGQPLVFVFALIVGALILFWGVQQVFKLVNTASTVEAVDWVNDFRKSIETYYLLDEGSSKTINVRLPNNVKYVCFKGQGSNEILDKYPNAKVIMENSDSNLYLLPIDSFEKTNFRIDKLRVSGNTICVKNNGKFRITSMEDYVKASNL